MKELSLNILDVAHNSISAGAKNIELSLSIGEETITVDIKDDGCGMSPEMLKKVTDPFTTTRTTRKVGMGLPLYKLAAEQTGGSLSIESRLGEGTDVSAVFYKNHIDCPPIGDMPLTIAMLMAAAESANLIYRFKTANGEFEISSDELREILGEGISLSEPEIQGWITEYIKQQEALLK